MEIGKVSQGCRLRLCSTIVRNDFTLQTRPHISAQESARTGDRQSSVAVSLSCVVSGSLRPRALSSGRRKINILQQSYNPTRLPRCSISPYDVPNSRTLSAEHPQQLRFLVPSSSHNTSDYLIDVCKQHFNLYSGLFTQISTALLVKGLGRSSGRRFGVKLQ